MTGLNVRTTLRYRPGPDVLSGEIGLRAAGGGATSTESPDADSTFVWVAAHTNEVRSQGEYLSSFQLVHASARLADDTAVTPLPAVIERAARALIATSLEALTFHNSTAARLRAKAESSRGRAALTECERQALERAFRDLDDPASWHQVSESLDQLTLLIERSERA